MMNFHSKKHHGSDKKSQDPSSEKQETAPSPAPGKDGKIEISVHEYEELKKKVQEIEGLREKFLRAAADFENAKKRNAKEKEDFIKFSQERILREILPVLDNFERAVSHATAASANASAYEDLRKNLTTVIAGVERVEKQLVDILKMHGLKRIETSGQIFNPHFHEAVAHVAEEGKEDQIVDELEPGYMLHDRLLRPAKVRVRTSPKRTSAPEEKQDEIT
ncbi:MAG TPA: nucleotide exchange factor GrpE [Candidatus Omnitrophota bacterium]|jgi:molecular chaperone GrpE|nr:nucleotide exchange factor GrpE [Candidatus Omnitrophota bacterium]